MTTNTDLATIGRIINNYRLAVDWFISSQSEHARFAESTKILAHLAEVCGNGAKHGCTQKRLANFKRFTANAKDKCTKAAIDLIEAAKTMKEHALPINDDIIKEAENVIC